MLGGIAAVVVLGGFGYALTRGRTADPTASPSNADRMSRTRPPIPDTGAPAAKSANPLSTVAVAANGASAPIPRIVDVDKVLDSLEERAKGDKPAAREVLRRLSALAPALVATGDSVHAALARFEANGRSCRNVEPLAPGGDAVEHECRIGFGKVIVATYLHRPVSLVRHLEFRDDETLIEAVLARWGKHLAGDHGTIHHHRIGSCTVTSLVPSGKVAST